MLIFSDKSTWLTGDGLESREDLLEHEELLTSNISHTSEECEDWHILDGLREEHLPEEEQLLEEEESLSLDTEDGSESWHTEEEWPTLDTEPILEELLPPEEELGSQEEELTSSISPEEELPLEDTESTWPREEDISHGSEEWETEQEDSSTDLDIITDEHFVNEFVHPPTLWV
mgnify:CR=1 FL=1